MLLYLGLDQISVKVAEHVFCDSESGWEEIIRQQRQANNSRIVKKQSLSNGEDPDNSVIIIQSLEFNSTVKANFA